MYCDLLTKSWFPNQQRGLELATVRYFSQNPHSWQTNSAESTGYSNTVALIITGLLPCGDWKQQIIFQLCVLKQCKEQVHFLVMWHLKCQIILLFIECKISPYAYKDSGAIEKTMQDITIDGISSYQSISNNPYFKIDWFCKVLFLRN